MTRHETVVFPLSLEIHAAAVCLHSMSRETGCVSDADMAAHPWQDARVHVAGAAEPGQREPRVPGLRGRRVGVGRAAHRHAGALTGPTYMFPAWLQVASPVTLQLACIYVPCSSMVSNRAGSSLVLAPDGVNASLNRQRTAWYVSLANVGWAQRTNTASRDPSTAGDARRLERFLSITSTTRIRTRRRRTRRCTSSRRARSGARCPTSPRPWRRCDCAWGRSTQAVGRVAAMPNASPTRDPSSRVGTCVRRPNLAPRVTLRWCAADSGVHGLAQPHPDAQGGGSHHHPGDREASLVRLQDVTPQFLHDLFKPPLATPCIGMPTVGRAPHIIRFAYTHLCAGTTSQCRHTFWRQSRRSRWSSAGSMKFRRAATSAWCAPFFTSRAVDPVPCVQSWTQ